MHRKNYFRRFCNILGGCYASYATQPCKKDLVNLLFTNPFLRRHSCSGLETKILEHSPSGQVISKLHSPRQFFTFLVSSAHTQTQKTFRPIPLPYMIHVTITRRKPFFEPGICDSACWRFQNGKHCKPLACGQCRLF